MSHPSNVMADEKLLTLSSVRSKLSPSVTVIQEQKPSVLPPVIQYKHVTVTQMDSIHSSLTNERRREIVATAGIQQQNQIPPLPALKTNCVSVIQVPPHFRLQTPTSAIHETIRDKIPIRKEFRGKSVPQALKDRLPPPGPRTNPSGISPEKTQMTLTERFGVSRSQPSNSVKASVIVFPKNRAVQMPGVTITKKPTLNLLNRKQPAEQPQQESTSVPQVKREHLNPVNSHGELSGSSDEGQPAAAGCKESEAFASMRVAYNDGSSSEEEPTVESESADDSYLGDDILYKDIASGSNEEADDADVDDLYAIPERDKNYQAEASSQQRYHQEEKYVEQQQVKHSDAVEECVEGESSYMNTDEMEDEEMIDSEQEYFGEHSKQYHHEHQVEENLTGEQNVECYVLSSDDEENDFSYAQPSTSVPRPENEPESGLFGNSVDDLEDYDSVEYDEMMESGEETCLVKCRTVRIGSYKTVPCDDVIFGSSCFKMTVPSMLGDGTNVILEFPCKFIGAILAHFGRNLPVIFVYVHNTWASVIRQGLRMFDEKTQYFYNPSSQDETQKRITFLPQRLSEHTQNFMRSVYGEMGLLRELSAKQANELLMRSTPAPLTGPQPRKDEIQTVMVYPPPPTKGGITINTEDYSCLALNTFLNDAIIDFYLKYILFKYYPHEEERDKIYIFSSFFYKRLTDKTTPIFGNNSTLTPAEVRHKRVRNWTKNIDLFTKDFIVIPVNENSHWYLAVICFPGLEGPVRFEDNTPVPPIPVKVKRKKQKQNEKGEDSKEAVEDCKNILSGRDEEERDEADGSDEDMDYYDYNQTAEDIEDMERGPIKQPCILILDSLSGWSKSKVVATLREYLTVEYRVKHGKERSFGKEIVKGDCPKVPQQTNLTDCGLFLLEYVETLFTQGIPDFRVPMMCINNWFDPRIVSYKRHHIQQVIHIIMREQGMRIDLPQINTKGGSASSPDEVDSSMEEEDDFDDNEEEGYEEEEEEEGNEEYGEEDERRQEIYADEMGESDTNNDAPDCEIEQRCNDSDDDDGYNRKDSDSGQEEGTEHHHSRRLKTYLQQPNNECSSEMYEFEDENEPEVCEEQPSINRNDSSCVSMTRQLIKNKPELTVLKVTPSQDAVKNVNTSEQSSEVRVMQKSGNVRREKKVPNKRFKTGS